MKTILVTGALGRVGAITTRHLVDRGYTVRGVDICAPKGSDDVSPLDLSDAGQAEIAVAGADAIIHLAASLSEDDWSEILQHNIVATRNVYEAARKHRVRRIVLASSHHVIGMYPASDRIGIADPVRPDSLYGLSKCLSEDLGRYYFDKFGIETVAVRIGALREAPELAREYAIWLSPADWGRLLDGALTTPEVGYQAVWGVSDNEAGWWGNPASDSIGYRPQDDAGAVPAAIAAKADPHDPAIYLQGGKRAALNLGGSRK